jgi:hypothetical protein
MSKKGSCVAFRKLKSRKGYCFVRKMEERNRFAHQEYYYLTLKDRK